MSVDVRPVSKRGTVGVPPENDTFGAIDQPNGTSTVPRVSAPAAVLSDEFERTLATTIGSPDVGPAAAVQSAASVFGVADGHNLGLITHGSGTWDVVGWDLGKKNVVLTIDETFGATPSAGNAVRIVDALNFLGVELADTVAKLFKVVAGARTDVATATIGRRVTDGATTNAKPWVTSATAAFDTTDVGQPIAASAGVPAGTLVKGGLSSTAPSAWQSLTVVALGATVIPATPNGHAYRAIAGGTTASGAPVFPTNGSVVADGTVVWRDLGIVSWVANTALPVSYLIRPSTGNGHVYAVTTAGTTGGSEPTWVTNGTTNADGTAVWTDLGAVASAATLTANGSATGTGRTVTVGVSTKSGTHRVALCADVDLLAVHVDDVPVVSYFLSTAELATFGAATVHGYWQAGATDTTSVAARISAFPVTQRAVYNGQGPSTAAPYQLFKASSVAGGTWFKGPSAVIAPPGGTAAQMKDPCWFYVGTRLWCLYNGVGSPTTLQQVHAMYSDSDGAVGTWVQSPNNPVLAAGAAGSCDSTSCTVPVVLVDPSDLAAPIKVVYNAFDGTTRTVALATGLVPDSLTKWAGNPAIRPSSSANAWDAIGVWPGLIAKIGGLWHTMLEGRYQASKESIGHATAQVFLSRWTKDPASPLFGSQRQKFALLTADWPAASTTVTVGIAAASALTRGEPVIVSNGANGTTGGVLTWVVDIDAEAGTVTTNDPAPSAQFTVAAGARIRSVWSGSFTPRSVVYETSTGKYVMATTAFRAFSGDLRETSVSMAAPSLSGPWAAQYGRGLLWPLGGVTSGDELSAENAWIIPVAAA